MHITIKILLCVCVLFGILGSLKELYAIENRTTFIKCHKFISCFDFELRPYCYINSDKSKAYYHSGQTHDNLFRNVIEHFVYGSVVYPLEIICRTIYSSIYYLREIMRVPIIYMYQQSLDALVYCIKNKPVTHFFSKK